MNKFRMCRRFIIWINLGYVSQIYYMNNFRMCRKFIIWINSDVCKNLLIGWIQRWSSCWFLNRRSKLCCVIIGSAVDCKMSQKPWPGNWLELAFLDNLILSTRDVIRLSITFDVSVFGQFCSVSLSATFTAWKDKLISVNTSSQDE